MKTSDRSFLVWVNRIMIVIGAISSLLCAYYVGVSFLGKSKGSSTHIYASFISSEDNKVSTVNRWQLLPEKAVSKPLSDRLTWRSSRPGFYFGLQGSRSENQQFGTGLVWYAEGSRQVRHETVHNEMQKLEWTMHNGKSYGEQHIIDSSLGGNLHTSFLIPSRIDEALSPSWMQHIQLQESRQAANFVFYLSHDCSDLDLENRVPCLEVTQFRNLEWQAEDNGSNIFVLSGCVGASDSDQFAIHFEFPDTTSPNDVHIGGHAIASHDLYSGSTQLVDELRSGIPNNSQFLNGFGEVRHTLDTASTTPSSFIAIKFRLKSNSQVLISYFDNVGKHNAVVSRFTSFQEQVILEKQKFQTRFQQLIRDVSIPEDQFGASKDMQVMIQAALSSLLGGIGEFTGIPTVSSSLVDHVQPELSRELVIESKVIKLLTSTPSRTSFPRGFLWDEGFHLLLLVRWDLALAMDILHSWLQAMYISDTRDMGWIPREMILGRDGVRRVPSEFIPQRLDIANPPTFFLVLQRMMDMYEEHISNRNEDKNQAQQQQCADEQDSCDENVVSTVPRFLQEIYPRLQLWLNWFLFTQSGVRPGSFRWRGRSANDGKFLPNTLSSGLDDYPRAISPTREERHVDLHAWMVIACQTMARIESILPAGEQQQKKATAVATIDYAAQAVFLQTKLDEYHWSNGYKGYFDYGFNNESAIFLPEILCRCGDPNTRTAIDGYIPVQLLQQSHGKPEVQQSFCPASHPQFLSAVVDGGSYKTRERMYAANFTHTFIPRIGYVALFPLLLKLIPAASPKLDYVLTMLEDEEKGLWTPYGLRSMGAGDKFYQRKNAAGDAPYWRGPIWININYLALAALNYYASVDGPQQHRCQATYTKLRSALLNNVLRVYTHTGFFWEQYDDKTGDGMRGHPFTGWTALIVNIFTEKY